VADHEPYPTAAGVEAAIKDAAKKLAASDPSLDTGKRIQLEYFRRFPSRVFGPGRRTRQHLFPEGGTVGVG
jgi:hypothetical protein